jgi:chemotaxis methyl-accepting protein methylase
VTPPDDLAFARLAQVIAQGSGFTVEAYKEKCVRRRIAVRMRACGVHTYQDYQTLLERTPAEYELLRDALTINVTRFYRNAETWNRLRRDLVPQLCAEPMTRLTAWSAGCSSGEEPYTLAALIADALDRSGRADQLDRVTIDATDVDRGSLERAAGGRYSTEALSEMPPELVRAYFEADGAEHRVIERLRRRVHVRRLDLNQEPPVRRAYHLILCRNVVIYFDRLMQEQLFQTFATALAPGGYLVLGKVETLFGPARDLLQLIDPRERIYRRPG